MELIVKLSCAGLASALLALVIKKSSPELALVLALVTTACIFAALVGMAESFSAFIDTLKSRTELSESFVRPVLKCLGIGIITKISAELCRDAAQNSLAAAIELAGTVCAMAVALPLLTSLITTVCGIF